MKGIEDIFRKEAVLFRHRMRLGRPSVKGIHGKQGDVSLTPVLQTEASDCGLACIAMLLAHHGTAATMQDLRSRFPPSMRGTTLGEMIGTMSHLGLRARPVRADLDDLQRLQLPAILHWDFNHFVVIERLSRRSAIVCDPSVGKLEISLDELSNHFTGVAMEVDRREHIELIAGERLGFRELTDPLRRMRSRLMVVILTALLVEACALSLPFFVRLMVDVSGSADKNLSAAVLCCIFLGVVTVYSITSWFRAMAVSRLSLDFNRHWLSSVYEHLLRLPYTFFQKRYVSDIIYRFKAVRDIQTTISQSATESILDGVLSAVALAMLFFYSPLMAAITAFFFSAYVLIKVAIGRRQIMAIASLQQQQMTQQSFLHETIKGILPIKMQSTEGQRASRWQNHLKAADDREVRVRALSAGANSARVAAVGVDNIVVVYLGGQLLVAGTWSVGQFLAFYVLKMIFQQKGYALIDKLAEVSLIKPQLDQLADLVLTKPEPSSTTFPMPETVHELSIEGVSYRYAPGDPNVLEGCTMVVGRGEVVAITGSSGAGKSTLIRILAGVVSPSGGSLLLNGKRMHSEDLPAYRTLVGAVLQDESLTAGTIGENIAFGDVMLDLERLRECAYRARILSFVESQPLGFDTPCGDSGSTLSVGQRQRLLLARVLYKRPKILILDEATSNLDPANEAEIFESLRGLDAIKIIVAHREETVRLASRKYQLLDGELVECAMTQLASVSEDVLNRDLVGS